MPYTIVDTAHPIMQGMSNFTIKDEAFFLMTWSKSPEIHVLATAVMAATPSAKGRTKGEVVPQIWTYEQQLVPAPTGQPYRAFVWMQGHNYSNFAHPQVQPMLLRAIAWAGKRPVDTLLTERPARTGTGQRGRLTRVADPEAQSTVLPRWFGKRQGRVHSSQLGRPRPAGGISTGGRSSASATPGRS